MTRLLAILRRLLQPPKPVEQLLRIRRVPLSPSLLVALFQHDGSKRLAFDGLPADSVIVDISAFHDFDMIFAFVGSKEFEPVLVTGRPTINLRDAKIAYQIPPLWLMVRSIDDPLHDYEPSTN